MQPKLQMVAACDLDKECQGFFCVLATHLFCPTILGFDFSYLMVQDDNLRSSPPVCFPGSRKEEKKKRTHIPSMPLWAVLNGPESLLFCGTEFTHITLAISKARYVVFWLSPPCPMSNQGLAKERETEYVGVIWCLPPALLGSASLSVTLLLSGLLPFASQGLWNQMPPIHSTECGLLISSVAHRGWIDHLDLYTSSAPLHVTVFIGQVLQKLRVKLKWAHWEDWSNMLAPL